MSPPGAGPQEPRAQFSKRPIRSETWTVTSKWRLVPGVMTAPGIWHDSASAGTGPQAHSAPSGVTVRIWTGVPAPMIVAASLTRTGPVGAAVPILLTVMRQDTSCAGGTASQVLVMRSFGWPGSRFGMRMSAQALLLSRLVSSGIGMHLGAVADEVGRIVVRHDRRDARSARRHPARSTTPGWSQRNCAGPSGRRPRAGSARRSTRSAHRSDRCRSPSAGRHRGRCRC